MNNEGKITIFLSLIIVVSMGFISAILACLSIYAAKTKAVTASETAASSIKADYNSFIFERYHILLIDKNYGGYGEGQIEELITESLEYTLGDDYVVEGVVLSETTGILDNECEEFKRQITDYLKYAACEYAVDEIVSAAGDAAMPIDSGDINAMDEVVSGGGADTTIDMTDISGGDADTTRAAADVTRSVRGASEAARDTAEAETDTSAESASSDEPDADDDPRKKLNRYKLMGVHHLTLPDDLELSDNEINRSELPSFGRTGIIKLDSLNTDFDDYDDLKDDLVGTPWLENMVNEGSGLVYAPMVFKCATDDLGEESYINLELEYIVCGGTSDYANYKEVVNKILALRMPVNFAYLITDTAKMSQIKTVSWSVFLTTGIPEPITRYLIAGCWAYMEGIVEVRGLMEGKSVPYIKDSSTWITDFKNLGNITDYECMESDNGLDYKDFLLILMAMDLDGSYYRMLDVIQMNANMEDETFRMENAITGFTADMDISYGGISFGIRKEAAY